MKKRHLSAHALDPENKSVSGLPTGTYSVPLPQLLAFAIHLRCRSSALIFAFIFTGQGGGCISLCVPYPNPLSWTPCFSLIYIVTHSIWASALTVPPPLPFFSPSWWSFVFKDRILLFCSSCPRSGNPSASTSQVYHHCNWALFLHKLTFWAPEKLRLQRKDFWRNDLTCSWSKDYVVEMPPRFNRMGHLELSCGFQTIESGENGILGLFGLFFFLRARACVHRYGSCFSDCKVYLKSPTVLDKTQTWIQ